MFAGVARRQPRSADIGRDRHSLASREPGEHSADCPRGTRGHLAEGWLLAGAARAGGRRGDDGDAAFFHPCDGLPFLATKMDDCRVACPCFVSAAVMEFMRQTSDRQARAL